MVIPRFVVVNERAFPTPGIIAMASGNSDRQYGGRCRSPD